MFLFLGRTLTDPKCQESHVLHIEFVSMLILRLFNSLNRHAKRPTTILSHSSLPPPTLQRSSSAMPRTHIPVMNVGTSPPISAGTMEEGGRYKSPPAAHKCIFHLLNSLGVLLQTANILQASNNTNIYELMNNTSLLCGTLALVLLVLLLVPAFGWFTLACWALYFLIIGTKSYQTLRTLCADAVPYVRDKMKELMRRLNGSEEPQNEGV
ncbi:uncharacterized protein [Malus domestica]|uniref:uncharacterized protein isoform X3 n=1 Tax=Malus domestica TaxID=3750 RepID=UPI00397616EF